MLPLDAGISAPDLALPTPPSEHTPSSVKNSEAIDLSLRFNLSKYSILQEGRELVLVFLRFWDSGIGRFVIPLTADSLFEGGHEPTARRSSGRLVSLVSG